MKKIFCLLILVLGSFILPMINVNAIDGFIGFAGITIPKSKDDNWYSGLNYNKTQYSSQWYWSAGAIENLTGMEIEILGRTWDGNRNSSWIKFTKQQYVTWGQESTSSFNGNIGTYGLDIRRKSSGLFAVSHSGNWYLNENMKT